MKGPTLVCVKRKSSGCLYVKEGIIVSGSSDARKVFMLCARREFRHRLLEELELEWEAVDVLVLAMALAVQSFVS